MGGSWKMNVNHMGVGAVGNWRSGIFGRMGPSNAFLMELLDVEKGLKHV